MIGYLIKQAVLILVEIVEVAILVRVFISFLGDLRNSKFADIVFQFTEPILLPCRALLERIGLGNGMFDFSPILAYFLLRLIVLIVYAIF